MGRNYFNEFKSGLAQTFNPMTALSKDPTGVSKIFEFPSTNMPQLFPPLPIPSLPHLPSLPSFPSNPFDPSANASSPALKSVADMEEKLKTIIQSVMDKIGLDKISEATGIPESVLRAVMEETTGTKGMRNLADVAQVFSAIVEAAAGGPLDIFGDLAAEQIMEFASTLTSVADLIDAGKETVDKAKKIGEHWNNGDYDKILDELADMSNILAKVAQKEITDELKLDEFETKMRDLAGKSRQAQKFRDDAKTFFGLTKDELNELEEDQDRDAENFRQQAAEIDELRDLEIIDSEELKEGQEKLQRGQHQIEAQNRRILAEEGALEHGQLLNRELQRKQIQSSRDNNQLLREITKDNRSQTQAIKHGQVIQDNELQKLDTDERDEIDATLRMATKLDPPRDIADFVKDLDSYETNPHRIQYIAENYEQFIRLPADQIDNLLNKMLDMGIGVAF